MVCVVVGELLEPQACKTAPKAAMTKRPKTSNPHFFIYPPVRNLLINRTVWKPRCPFDSILSLNIVT